MPSVLNKLDFHKTKKTPVTLFELYGWIVKLQLILLGKNEYKLCANKYNVNLLLNSLLLQYENNWNSVLA